MNVSESSKKQIHFSVNASVYRKWDEYRREHGFATMAGFISHAINALMYPLPGNQESLDAELGQLRDLRRGMEKDLKDLIIQREILYPKHQLHIPKLEYRILDYLERTGPANEYMIAEDLKVQASEVYHVCAYLATQKKIHQDARGNWQL